MAIVRPYCSPDPGGPKYEQYCRQSLMQHVPFRHLDDLLGSCTTYAEAFAVFLQSGSVPPSLEDDIYRLQKLQQQSNDPNAIESVNISPELRSLAQPMLHVHFLV